MKTSHIILLLGLTLGFIPVVSYGQQSMLGKFYVTSVKGTVKCIVDGRIIELKKGDTIPTGGTIIETDPGASITMVLSNGTNIFADEKTHFEFKKFEQEPFAPNNNLLIEPSNTQSITAVTAGRLVISTPQLVSGTSMTFETQHSSTTLVSNGNDTGGNKVLIEVTETQSHIALIGGNVSIKPRGADGEFISLGQRLTAGQQAVVKYTLTESENNDTTGGGSNPTGSPSTGANPDDNSSKRTTMTVSDNPDGGKTVTAPDGTVSPGSTGRTTNLLGETTPTSTSNASGEKPTSLIILDFGDSQITDLLKDMETKAPGSTAPPEVTITTSGSPPIIVFVPIPPKVNDPIIVPPTVDPPTEESPAHL